MSPPALLEGLFVSLATEQPVLYVSWVVAVVVSVVLHELGHGVAALAQGDDTPRTTGHMTLDPFVHMGAFSLVALFLVGIAWGQMPVNPARFRHRHGDAVVSAAGPGVNLVLALVGLTAYGLVERLAPAASGTFAANLRVFLYAFGVVNVVLFLLNLIPIPPLDGSRVLASFSRPYRRLATDPNNGGLFLVIFLGVFFASRWLFLAAHQAAGTWVDVVAGRMS